MRSRREYLFPACLPYKRTVSVANSGIDRNAVEWTIKDVAWPIPIVPVNVAAASALTFAPTVTLGKRSREVGRSHGDGCPGGIDTHKKARAGTSYGILKGTRTVARSRRGPVARTPNTNINSIPKEAGRRVEMLATTNTQGIYHRSLLGPSFQQGCAVEAADEQLVTVEGRVEEEAVQRQQQEEGKDKSLKIPGLEMGYKALLAATQADWARGAIREIKCRFCPDIQLKTWGNFTRHCETTEAHPLNIFFCEDCGDFFARSDSLKRHRKKPPPECISVTPEKAAMKRGETQRLHEQFRVSLERSLEKREDIGMPFSQVIKNLYPESSKKRTGGSRSKGR